MTVANPWKTGSLLLPEDLLPAAYGNHRNEIEQHLLHCDDDLVCQIPIYRDKLALFYFQFNGFAGIT